ncbi:MFS transporter [Variovorax boronicumulans]|uniref:MFS transporter n=1 Tax=Variovorax boronicumulans TaxID=436515 RepID=UPI0035A910FD
MSPIPDIEKSTIRTLYWRIMPFLILCYIVAFLDRVNVGFAALHMNADLGFTATVYGFGAGIFSIGYFLFEVPSNLILNKVGARIWIARIMVTWGLISAGFAFIQGQNSFYAMRFLLGVAEAGFFPGIILYLTKWFPARVLGSAVAVFLLGLPIAVLIGAPVSTAILATTHELGGLRNWQWMFILEGGLAVVVGVIAFFVLTSDPSTARFLSPEQRRWLVDKLASERRAKEGLRVYSVREGLFNGKVLILSLAIFCNITALFGVTLWMPQIIKAFGGLSNTEAGLLTGVPYLCAGVAMVLNARHSDRTGERRFHVLIAACIGAVGLLMAALAGSPVVAMVGICIGAAGILSSNILFWPLPSLFLTGAAAAAGIAMVNSVGNLGGFVGPYLTGWAKDYFGTYSAGMCVLAAMVTLYGLIICRFLTVMARRATASDPAVQEIIGGVQPQQA